MDEISILSNINSNIENYTNVTDDGGVKKLIIKQGVGNVISHGATVEAHYSAYHNENLKIPFDSTRLRGKTFSVDIPQSIDDIKHIAMSGIEIGITTMKLYEESIFILQPNYAMGAYGCYPRVPPNATCYVTIVIISVGYSHALIYEEMPRLEKRYADYDIFESAMLRRKQQARLAFNAKNYQIAADIYKKALIHTDMYSAKDDLDDIRRNKLSIDIENNIALCYLRMNNPTKALKVAEEVLFKDKNNAKANYYKAKACRLIGNLYEAEEALKLANKISPNDNSIYKEFAELEKEYEYLETTNDISENMKKMWSVSNRSIIRKEKKNLDSEKIKSRHLITEAVADLIEKTIQRFVIDDNVKTFTFTSEYFNQEELVFCEQLSIDNGLSIKKTMEEDDSIIRNLFILK